MSTSKQIWMFRHGLATLNPAGYGSDNRTVELLPEGFPHITRLAKFLKTEVFKSSSELPQCYVSEFTRCQQTAQKVAEVVGFELHTDSRLNEHFEENFADFELRMIDLANDLLQRPDQKIIVCTHGIVIGALSHLLTGRAFDLNDQFDFPPTAGLRLIQDNKVNQWAF